MVESQLVASETVEIRATVLLFQYHTLNASYLAFTFNGRSYLDLVMMTSITKPLNVSANSKNDLKTFLESQ